MGHAIHKHMNSFKAKNLLGEMPIPNKASALEMNEGSATYIKKDPQENLKKPYKETRRAKQNAGVIKNTPEEIAQMKAAREAKKAALANEKK